MPATENDIALFTREELETALALFAQDENARDVAAAVYAIPQEEQGHYDWIFTALLMLSCKSEDLAERVRRHFAPTEEIRVTIERKQREFAEWYRTRIAPQPRRMFLEPEDIVYDVRQDPPGMVTVPFDP